MSERITRMDANLLGRMGVTMEDPERVARQRLAHQNQECQTLRGKLAEAEARFKAAERTIERHADRMAFAVIVAALGWFAFLCLAIWGAWAR